MSNYKAIDDLVATYKHGQESPDNSPERESSRVAGQRLVMTFKPLILSTMQCMTGIGPADYEDAYQDGVVAFMEGMKKYDETKGGRFNAFIKTHLQLYYRKWQSGQFNHSVTAEKLLSAPAGSSDGLTLEEVFADEAIDLEGCYIEREDQQRLWKSVHALSARQGKVLYQSFHESKSLVQICKEMGVTHKAVRKLRDKGLKNLKKSLKGVPF